MAIQTLVKGDQSTQGTSYSATGDKILLNGNHSILPVVDYEVAGITIHSITAGTLDVQLTTDKDETVWGKVIVDGAGVNILNEAEAICEFSVSTPTAMKITANGGDVEFSLRLKNE